jgi:hypothetical protein
MMAQGDASNIANKTLGQRERQSLRAIRSLIDKYLQQPEDGRDAIAAADKQPTKVDNAGDVDMLL